MDKQEAAFRAWLNTVLAPAPADVDGSSEGSSTAGHRGLASRRLTARLRGLLWQLYSQDQELVRCVHGCLEREITCKMRSCGRAPGATAMGLEDLSHGNSAAAA